MKCQKVIKRKNTQTIHPPLQWATGTLAGKKGHFCNVRPFVAKSTNKAGEEEICNPQMRGNKTEYLATTIISQFVCVGNQYINIINNKNNSFINLIFSQKLVL